MSKRIQPVVPDEVAAWLGDKPNKQAAHLLVAAYNAATGKQIEPLSNGGDRRSAKHFGPFTETHPDIES